MSDLESNAVEDPQPYPGLRYYTKNSASMFAGRDAQLKKCIPELISSSILVLHGRTGCGKSSFLRAGIKPFLKNHFSEYAFDEGDSLEGFEVIRSSNRPLRELASKVKLEAGKLLELAEKPNLSALMTFGQLKKNIAKEKLERLKSLISDDQFLDRIGDDYYDLVQIMQLMGSILKSAPIFVIDQAEEIFTIKHEPVVDNVADSQDSSSAEAKTEDTSEDNQFIVDVAVENRAYFRFLHAFAQSEGVSKIVVSLRTEYKGQFDNELQIAAGSKQNPKIRGFYLADLNKTGLKEAILRPTLKNPVLGMEEISPFEKYGFEFEPEVVDSLIEQLLSDKVPAGGVLPVLQVACLRLWQIAHRVSKNSISGKRKKKIKISQDHFFQLGSISNQIEEYLYETIETQCTNVATEIEKSEKSTSKNPTSAWPEDQIDETITNRWHRILNLNLVRIESDGRAVTKSTSLDDFIESANERIGAGANKKAIGQLIDNLSKDSVAILRNENGIVTLGHDSLALALSKWSLRFGQQNMSMMRMMMSSSGLPDKYDEDELFPHKDDKPHQISLYVPQDFAWDHQLPFFAQAKGFAERLGIKIIADEDLIARNLQSEKGGLPDLPALNFAIVDREIKKNGFEQARKERKSNDRLLVSADWNTFPGSADYVNPDRSHKEKAELTRKDFLWRFSDVLVSDLFFGFGLIGQVSNWSSKIKNLQDLTGDPLFEGQVKLINDALNHIMECNGQIMCHNRVSINFLKIAAKRCNNTNFQEYIKKDKGKYPNILNKSNADYKIQDPLISWLREDLSDKPEKEQRPRFIVGTSHSRALAHQAGFSLLFDTNHVASATNYKIEEIKAKRLKSEQRLIEISELSKDIQKIVSHNLWQLSIPASQWEQGVNRATILRIASLGYFTTEYVRTNAREFVLHLQEFLKDILATRVDGGQARLTRSTIEKIWQDCYSLYRFEEAGSNYFDPDSVHAYLTEHMEQNSVSIASSVYSELVRLRAETQASFEMVSKMLSWLHARGLYKEDSPDIWKAYQYKQSAWKNFRIFNFYDSEWQMALASRHLKIEMERQSNIIDESSV